MINYYLILINIIGFTLYGIDKLKAITKQFRIREITLIIISFIGGSLGTTLGMIIFRHKTRKPYFVIINITLLIIQILLYKHFLY